MFRILEVKPKGFGKDVEIKAFDTKNYDLHVFFDKISHVVPSIELIESKTSKNYLIPKLNELYPHIDFKLKKYGFSSSSYVLWASGDRSIRKELEFELSKKKQIFITNQEHRYKPRTIKLSDESLDSLEEYFSLDSDIKKVVRRNNQLELKTSKSKLKELPDKLFKIVQYDSPTLTHDEALELKQKIRGSSFKKYVEGLKILEKDEGFTLRLRTINHQIIDKKFSRFNKKKNKSGSIDYVAGSVEWDPLNLNSPTTQLRQFFPLYTEFDPSKSLVSQKNFNLNPHRKDLEKIISETTNFYKKNTAVIDIEVKDYTKEALSGQIYMVVLKSLEENNLYLTKEVFDDKIKRELKQYDGANLVFCDDEVDLIKKLDEDAANFQFIIGHNFDDFDHEHLRKFNSKEKIWNINKNQQVLDTYKYIQKRTNLLKDRKLETLGRFDKSISYEEMDKLLAEMSFSSIKKVIDYTVEDGKRTWDVLTDILDLAVIESMATNKSLPSLFRNEPDKNFYDDGHRRYFLKLNTYRDRHERSPMRHIEKFSNRKTNDEILTEVFSSDAMYKKIDGDIYYPTVLLDAFKPIINNNPVTNLLYKKILVETDPLKKITMLSILSGSIGVAVDKVKNYMEDADLTFGKEYMPHAVYPSLKYEFSEHEPDRAQTSFIFSKSYGVKNVGFQEDGLTYDLTMLNFNNKVALNLANQTGFNLNNLVVDGEGIKLGRFKGVSLGKANGRDRFLGSLDGLLISSGVKFPEKNTLKGDLLYGYLAGEDTNISDWYNFLATKKLSSDEKKFVKSVLEINPRFINETLYMF